MKPPSVVNALLCEDIRQEMSGKFSLAGVFASNMQVASLATPILIGIFAEIDVPESGSFQPEFRVIDAALQVAINGKMHIEAQQSGHVPLVLGPFAIILTKPGRVKFQWKFDDKGWKTIKEFDVIMLSGPVPPFNVSKINQQPGAARDQPT